MLKNVLEPSESLDMQQQVSFPSLPPYEESSVIVKKHSGLNVIKPIFSSRKTSVEKGPRKFKVKEIKKSRYKNETYSVSPTK